ncbi:MAG: transcription termination/antitermination protein NusG [Holosporales bacterium]|nr:transcription termination/antitermination protein NusG [Holosporales bacterium]
MDNIVAKNSTKWYIIHTYSGSEDRIASLILEVAAKKGLDHMFEDIIVPTEEVSEIKNGERVNVTKKYLPGYVLVKMYLNDDSWHIIKNIPRVSGFLGVKGKPIPVSDSEVERIVAQINETVQNPRHEVVFDIGDLVKITDGPFASFSGTIEEIEEDKQKLKVSVMVFGRPTPITLDYSQVERI